MSAFQPIATEQRTQFYVGFVPIPNSCTASNCALIRSPRRRGQAVPVEHQGRFAETPSSVWIMYRSARSNKGHCYFLQRLKYGAKRCGGRLRLRSATKLKPTS